MTKTTELQALPHVPFATVGKSTDINWRRWSDYTAAKAARARQIEALPELLSALQQARAWLGNMPSGHSSNAAVLPIIDAALKKAGVL
jgi:hypothetical protein